MSYFSLFSLPAFSAAMSSTASLAVAEYNGVFTDDESPLPEMEEFDERVVDDVQVSFYTRHVGSSGSEVAVAANTRDEEHDDWDEHSRHWALVFYFPNSGRYITHEAVMMDTKLVWVCKQMPPGKEYRSKLYVNIAKCRTSPKQLQEWAKEIKINNLPYNAAFRNCQEWIKLFAEAIGGEVCEYIFANFKSYFKNNPLMASVVGAAHSYVKANEAFKQKTKKNKKAV